MTKTKRLALIILTIVMGLTAIYYAMKWTTPKECMVPTNRMSPECISFIYPS